MPPYKKGDALLQAEIDTLRARELKLESYKAWETSYCRLGVLVTKTYIVAAVFLQTIGAQRPLVGALVPVLGYVISTLTLPIIRRWWVQRVYLKRHPHVHAWLEEYIEEGG